MSRRLAVTGYACRLPGAPDVASFLGLLREGCSALSAPTRPGLGDRACGLLDDPAAFDPGAFGIGDVEAGAMDPQQRLALELAWEALESAGIRLDAGGADDGSAVGVYLGVSACDYQETTLAATAGCGSALAMTGLARGLIANRISHHFALSGPSLVVDSAQSSSLTAVHLAAQGLASGDCDVALVGGTNLLLGPARGSMADELGVLSRSGESRPLDEAADGFVRGEGGVILVLERAGAAARLGRRIRALVLGSASGTGQGPGGLTAPCPDTHARVIQRALDAAGASTESVAYVELHGTGTRVGDPIEAAAVARAYRPPGSAGAALGVGSVKGAIGHLDAAAGIAGLLKTVLSVEHGQLFGTAGLSRPNPAIPFTALRLRAPTAVELWPSPCRSAGVSSLGIGGAVCHVVIESPPATPPPGPEPELPVLLSAHSPAALTQQAQRLATWCAADASAGQSGAERTLIEGRPRLRHWLVADGPDRATRLESLRAFAAGEGTPWIATGQRQAARTVFVFPGQGSQWAGMASALLAESAEFRAALETCERALEPHVAWSLHDVLCRPEGHRSLADVDVLQPTLWAVMVALARTWEAYGVRPDAVVGHSQGEIAAAHVCGALSLEAAAMVVCSRSRLIREVLGGHGGMLSIGLGERRLEAVLHDASASACVAAVNGPTSTVVSGEHAALDRLEGILRRSGTWCRRVPVDYASHSPAVDAMRGPLAIALQGLKAQSAAIPMGSSAVGRLIDTADLTADYWFTSLRQPVRFDAAVRAVLADGPCTLIEVSPHPVLTTPVASTISAAESEGSEVLGTLRRGRGGLGGFLAALAAADGRGVPGVGWSPVLTRTGTGPDLPPFAFQRRHLWVDTVEPAARLGTPLAIDLAAVEPADRHAAVLGHLFGEVARLTGHEARIDPHREFKDLGLESVGGLALRRTVATATGVALEPTFVFDHPTPALAAAHVVRSFEQAAGADSAERDPQRPGDISAMSLDELLALSANPPPAAIS